MTISLMNLMMCAMIAANLVGAIRSKNSRSRNIHFLVAGFGLGQMVSMIEYAHVG